MSLHYCAFSNEDWIVSLRYKRSGRYWRTLFVKNRCASCIMVLHVAARRCSIKVHHVAAMLCIILMHDGGAMSRGGRTTEQNGELPRHVHGARRCSAALWRIRPRLRLKTLRKFSFNSLECFRKFVFLQTLKYTSDNCRKVYAYFTVLFDELESYFYELECVRVSRNFPKQTFVKFFSENNASDTMNKRSRRNFQESCRCHRGLVRTKMHLDGQRLCWMYRYRFTHCYMHGSA